MGKKLDAEWTKKMLKESNPKKYKELFEDGKPNILFRIWRRIWYVLDPRNPF